MSKAESDTKAVGEDDDEPDEWWEFPPLQRNGMQVLKLQLRDKRIFSTGCASESNTLGTLSTSGLLSPAENTKMNDSSPRKIGENVNQRYGDLLGSA